MSAHKCFDLIDARLKPHNLRLATVVSYSSSTGNLAVEHCLKTEKLYGSIRARKEPKVTMKYCPFCGVGLTVNDLSNGDDAEAAVTKARGEKA